MFLLALLATGRPALADPVPAPPPAPAGTEAATTERVGFLVVAADRGYLGNEEVRSAFDAFVAGEDVPARLVFVTDARTGEREVRAVAELRDAGATRVAVLPLFVLPGDPRLALARSLLDQASTAVPVAWSPPFGGSHFAVDALSARLRTIESPGKRSLVLIAEGAADDASEQALEAELQRLLDGASTGLTFKETQVIAVRAELTSEERGKALDAAIGEAGLRKRSAVVLFHLGTKLDSMMALASDVHARVPDGAVLVDGDLGGDEALVTWMARDSRKARPLAWDDLGVVVLAHGAEFEWNDAMERAAGDLAARMRVEFAFSMADAPVVDLAVRRLEERGAKAIVVVRVFGLEQSFKSSVDRMFGFDVEGPHAGHGSHGDSAHGMHGMHGHGMGGGRVPTACPTVTVGGLEADPLFAAALLDRARALSTDPSKETIVLLAHGYGDPTTNEHWRDVLGRLAAWMRENGGSGFRAVEIGTWREDWPEEREAEVAAIRAIVEKAGVDGGRALVIPARTAGRGHEDEFLAGLSFAIGEGFAPSPQFSAWLDQEVAEGARALGIPLPPMLTAAEGGPAAGPDTAANPPAPR